MRHRHKFWCVGSFRVSLLRSQSSRQEVEGEGDTAHTMGSVRACPLARYPPGPRIVGGVLSHLLGKVTMGRQVPQHPDVEEWPSEALMVHMNVIFPEHLR
jgi:hypothetical protein